MLLTDYASNVYSQYGEDGMIEEILKRIEVGPGVCVEFGASDGVACSNTAKLWKHEDWKGVLIESEIYYTPTLGANVEGHNCVVKFETVTPQNVDALIDQKAGVDLISIDVDGDDYHIFCSMWTRAKVLVIEYNKTIPPHIDLVPLVGSKLGIGSLTLKNAAEQRGYTLLGLTEGNAIFVDTQYADRFTDISKELAYLQPPESLTYLATDFEGRILPLGIAPPWGLAWPPSDTSFRPNQDSLLDVQAMDSTERLIQAVESLDINPQHISEIRSAAMQIALDMRGGYNEELRARIEQELGLR